MAWIAGADGFKSRWCVVLQDLDTGELRVRIVPTFAGLLDLAERPSVVAVDIPIGLPEVTLAGGRACDAAARRRLGRRGASVFSAVGRIALAGANRAEADALNRAHGGIGVGAQAWGLADKLRQANAAMTPERQDTVREVHPEVSFWAMNGRTPMADGKKSAAGALARTDALAASGFPEAFVRRAPSARPRIGPDDFLDACAALWSARRIAAGSAERLPAAEDRDARGLDQAIWF
ncbi:DUF429 domain-containing protein [Methylobacterium sp. Leaf108]|uniref:DUF429 domain-containing protein n=1 Tax=Methylobacterium sp. Leaf108 TaxID=1736256 RepID=UPI0006FBE15A|nr:DUF429 domain-containing protein [Methylobacterium sp. Leaf108]KQP54992.1 hypothetical protein ASF39_04420 [Methylobacterium sp. Leaf108]